MQLEGFHRWVLIIPESTGQSIGKKNKQKPRTLLPPLSEDQHRVSTIPEVVHNRLGGGEDGGHVVGSRET